ncbi:MAG: FtsX-like permease family protein [Cellulophaga sp.]
MFKNQLKIAWRSLKKNPLQTGINILSLTVGTICCLIIISYVNAQFGYDTQHKDAASICRIRTKIKTKGNNSINADVATSSPPIAFALKEDFPEVVDACRVVYFGSGEEALIRNPKNNQSYYESKGYVADSTFFKFFNYTAAEGNLATALEKPNSIVLSKKLASKLFQDENQIINKTLVIGAGEDQFNATITGVFNEPANPTHLNPNYILCMNSPGIGEYANNITNFATQNFAYTYIKLGANVSKASLEKKLPKFMLDRGGNDLADMGFDKKLLLQSVTDIHLHSKGIDKQIEEVSNIEYLYALLFLAFIVQLVACVNFINLSTARASKRAKEIGVRKAIGAQKSSLVKQFLSESILIAFLAVFISIPIVLLLLPVANVLTGGNIEPEHILNLKILLLLGSMGLLTGLIAGIYPALVLSSFKPSKVLKGATELQSNNGLLRRGLVVFQFVVSIVLTVSVIIVSQQLKFAKQKDLGFNKDNLLAIRLGTQELQQNYSAIQSQLQGVPGVSSVTGSNNYPSRSIMGDLAMRLPSQDDDNLTSVYYNGITPNYLETIGTKIIKGRKLRATDSTGILVNMATLKAFNIDIENALAAKIISSYGSETEEYEVVGVTENFHFEDFKQAISPMLIYSETEPDWIVARLETSNIKSVLSGLEANWKKVNPYAPFEYVFVDKETERLYAEEQKLSKISIAFSILAILISCLGLFGLVSYVAEQKKKEIGIRKVLGASVKSVVQLLTKDFLKLVLVAFVIASPIAYYFMQNWLQDFTYKIEIKWWVFLLAGGFAMLITIVTVGFQSIKSAIANPVKSLRTE